MALKTRPTLMACAAVIISVCPLANADAADRQLYVAKGGSDGNTCLDANAPCLTISRGIAVMDSGDTLIVGDGTYAEQIVDMPSGTAGSYTTIKAKNDWGVVIDGSGFANNYNDGIRISAKSYVAVRGFKVKMAQAKDTNVAVSVPYSDHIKVQRVSASYGGVQGNVANIGVGPASSYVLIEEAFSYGGGRYQFLVYQSDHVIVRRSVARNDYWNGSLQCAGFTNYNSDHTVWENNIAIDSDTAHCAGRQYAGFFNENKLPDASYPGTATNETFRGNIILNVKAFYAAMYDYDISALHTYTDNIIWNSYGGLFADYIHGDAATLNASRMTMGAIAGAYDQNNGQGAAGVGFAVASSAVANALTNSVLWNNQSYGTTDWAVGNYNSYYGNLIAAHGGQIKTPTPGPNDIHTTVPGSLKYLPRIELGSALAKAGSDGGQIGADVRYMWGKTGTLWGEAEYDTKTTTCLWPFPNEAVIKAEMGSYAGPGGAGVRGFTSGTSMDGSAQSLTKYVWEYLGHQIPPGPLCRRADITPLLLLLLD